MHLIGGKLEYTKGCFPRIVFVHLDIYGVVEMKVGAVILDVLFALLLEAELLHDAFTVAGHST